MTRGGQNGLLGRVVRVSGGGVQVGLCLGVGVKEWGDFWGSTRFVRRSHVWGFRGAGVPRVIPFGGRRGAPGGMRVRRGTVPVSVPREVIHVAACSHSPHPYVPAPCPGRRDGRRDGGLGRAGGRGRGRRRWGPGRERRHRHRPDRRRQEGGLLGQPGQGLQAERAVRAGRQHVVREAQRAGLRRQERYGRRRRARRYRRRPAATVPATAPRTATPSSSSTATARSRSTPTSRRSA